MFNDFVVVLVLLVGENRSTQGNTPNNHLQSETKLYRINLAMCGNGTHHFGGEGHRLDRYK